jgi:TolA-binding protein
VKEPGPRAEGLNDLAQAQIGLKQFAEAQSSVDEGLKLQPVGEINAHLRVTAGDIQAAQGKWAEAAKIYNSVTVIIDDENITPGAGEKAVDAYRRAGLEDEAKKLLNRLQSRYPEYFQNKKPRTALSPM